MAARHVLARIDLTLLPDETWNAVEGRFLNGDLLLDTCAVLWLASTELPPSAQAFHGNLHVSPISAVGDRQSSAQEPDRTRDAGL